MAHQCPDNAEKTIYRRKEASRMRYWLLVLLTLCLSACQSPAPVSSNVNLELAKPITLSAKQVSSVRSGVARILKNQDLEAARFGRMLAGKTSTAVIVCGYVDGKNSEGEFVGERPFHGLFLGMDNASSFIVTGTGGTESENAATFDVCRRSGLDLSPS
jgi:hypothetical protein